MIWRSETFCYMDTIKPEIIKHNYKNLSSDFTHMAAILQVLLEGCQVKMVSTEILLLLWQKWSYFRVGGPATWRLGRGLTVRCQ
jgi:hypothetical protein